MLSIRQLQFFVAVAEAGQISAAARDLYVSQSAVTMAVQEIERTLRQPLFTRTSRGVTLTPTGTEFLPKARRILQLVEEATLISATDPGLSGRIRIGVSYTVMAYFLPHHLQRLTILFPNLELEWLELGRPDAEAALVAGELDFGLLLTSNIRHPDVRHETFVHSKRRLWLPPGHPLADSADVRLADVAPFPYVQLTVDETERTTKRYWGGIEPRVFLRTSSIEAVRSIVANGNGVTILSDMVYRPWSLEGKRVDTIVLRDPIPDMRIGLAWRAGAELTPAMTVLRQYFHGRFSQPESPGLGT